MSTSVPIYADFPCFLAERLPPRWSIEVWFGKRYGFSVFISKEMDRDSRIAVEDFPGGDHLDISGQILAAVNHAREEEGMKPVTWEDGP